MSARLLFRVLFGFVLTTCALSTPLDISVASANPCPDIEVVFARGTDEPRGVGSVGQAFVDSLVPKVGGRSVGVYAVDYPASGAFSSSASAGAAAASAHIQYMVANCPNTKMILGGFSQGAGVIDLITVGPVQVAGFTPAPMPPEVADHVAAVAVFGNPSGNFPGFGPLTAISPLYGPKTIDMCAPGDPLCTPGIPWQIWYPWFPADLSAHLSYAQNGMVGQAADFAASRL
ncbi:cutinase family protein [Mycobacterium sp. NPDC048908]|uniref:cutinase family protein n=1 Tax=Mycobacterium sp. NPDC048908 TaxID=3364292 RepID=UPI003723838B